MDNPTLIRAREKAAQAWCSSETRHLEMIPELAEVFADMLVDCWAEARLGNATTRELLEEITARIEMDGQLDYKTTGVDND